MDRDVRGQAARSSDPLRFVGQKWPIQVFLAPLLLGCVSLGFVFWLSRWLKLPPVAVCLIVAALMWCASSAAPSFDLMFPAYLLSSVGLALIGAAICISGVVSFSRAGTTVNPMKPGSASSFLVKRASPCLDSGVCCLHQPLPDRPRRTCACIFVRI